MMKKLFLSFIGIIASIGIATAQNAIVTENLLPGNPRSQWDEGDQGSIQGFAQEFSVNKGDTVHFKIDIDANINLAYSVEIFRLGYYQGNGARFIADLGPQSGQRQPAYQYDAATGKVDCSNWAVSCAWKAPDDAVSGVYAARLDCGGVASQYLILFVVRDDTAKSNILFKTSDATWQAYNAWGGNNFYSAMIPIPGYAHATKLSYQRPLVLRGDKSNFFNSEFPMLMWLERNGYDVTYATDMDMARDPSVFTPAKHKVLLSNGHDEYWSAEQRNKYETARNNGVSLAFFSGNSVYWKTRWEDNYKTLVCYKEGTQGVYSCGTKCDPLPNVWTGLWRDGCSPTYGSNDGCKPEGSLTAQMGWNETTGSIQVPDTFKNYRFWKNTSIAGLGSGQTVSLPLGTLGQEWDQEDLIDTYAPRRNRLSFTTLNGLNHSLALYKHPSGALVFSSGTMNWAWGLDVNHDPANPAPLPPSLDMQQATYNILFDMGAIPGSKQVDIITASANTDLLSPSTIITSPTHLSTVPGSPITITGTASENGGSVLTGVEVSVDNGVTWTRATGIENWSFTFTPTDYGTINIKSRGWDDVFNLEVPGNPGTANCITINLNGPFVHSVFDNYYPKTTPTFKFIGYPMELGMKFKSTSPGQIIGFRYYKHPNSTGSITGNLWSTNGTLLASQLFTTETASGWQSVNLTTPVNINPNTTYVVSYFSPLGKYVEEKPFFTTAFVNGQLKGLAHNEEGVNGVNNFNGSAYPIEGPGLENYYADVLFVSNDAVAPTITATSPAHSTIDVAINATPSVTFDELVSPGTITSSTFVVTGPGNVVIPGTLTVNGSTVTFTPTVFFDPLTSYTISIKGGVGEPVVKDYTGNKLGADSTFTFTTSIGYPPIVTTDPQAQAVCSDSTVSFTSAAVGFPAPTVQWQVSTDNGSNWNNILSEINPTYTFTPGIGDNGKKYRAVWTNSLNFANSQPATLTVNSCVTTLNLDLFLEGYYLGAGFMDAALVNQGISIVPTETDTILVELRNSVAPHAIVASTKTVLKTNGTAVATFSPISGSYYIAIKHRSSLQTWSADPVAVGAIAASYNFKTAAEKAFGSNMKQMGSIWAFYTGDLNQDDFIDASDFPLFDTDNFNGVSGVNSGTDMNGDGFVDASDYPVFDSNNFSGISAVYP